MRYGITFCLSLPKINLMQEIIATLERLRVTQGLTKRAISAAADITPEYYWKIVEGKCSPAFAIVERLADIVGLKLVLCLK